MSPGATTPSYRDAMTPSPATPSPASSGQGPSSAQGPADLLITGCTALVHDDHEGIAFVEDASIVVRGGVIEAVTGGASAVDAVERIDARGQVAMPGLINCHTHSPMVALRGIAEDLPAEEWFNDFIWPIESNLTARDVELGARLACAEMIRGGVTCFADHYFSMDTVAAVVAESGCARIWGGVLLLGRSRRPGKVTGVRAAAPRIGRRPHHHRPRPARPVHRG